MQNPEEMLHDLLCEKTFDKLSYGERSEVLMHLTENEYQSYSIILNKLSENVKRSEINPDIRFKKSLDKKVNLQRQKASVNLYKIAACIAVFLLISVFCIRKVTSPSQENMVQQTAKREGMINPTPAVKDTVKIIALIKTTNSSKEKSSIAKTAWVKPIQTQNKKEKLGEVENKKNGASENKLALDIDLAPFSTPCLNPENTQANNVTSELLRL